MSGLPAIYILLVALTGTGALRVRMNTTSMSALRGQNVTIPCDIIDLNVTKPIAIDWSKTLVNGTKRDVYEYNVGRIKQFRNGSHMNESEIFKGNATLYLPELQLSDDGEYTCSVFNNPYDAEGKITLQVSVQPNITLTPEDVHIEAEAEKSVSCEVTNFYPQNTMIIRWVRYNSDSSGCVALEKGTCTADPANNTDGTFNVTSHLTLNPRKEDNGNKYACVVTHRSLAYEIVRNFTLTVTEREDKTGAIIGAIIGTLLCTLLTVFCALLYLKRFKKDPPFLSPITGNDKLIDMSRATLTCQVMNYRPDDIEISVCLRRSGGEKMTIYTWKYRDSKPPARVPRDGAGGGHVAIDMEEQHGLMNGAARQEEEERPLQLEMVPVVSKKRFGTFSCQCSLHITPSYDMDNGAELSLHVTHPALTSPISVGRVLNVIGVAPKLLSILTSAYVSHDEKQTLTCPIIGFKPRNIKITWLRRDLNNQETELITWNSGNHTIYHEKYSHNLNVREHEDKSYSFQSALTLRPTVMEDDGVTYICRTDHPATQHSAEEQLTMKVTAVPVLDEIEKSPEVVYSGEKLELSCRIHSFYPKSILVTWYTEGGDPIPSVTSDPLPESTSGLHHVTSKASYTPTIRDEGKTFRCEVQHDSLTKSKLITWKLREIVSTPCVGEVQCDPPQPEIGKPVTLFYPVTDMYPKKLTVHLYSGLTRLYPNQWKEDFQQDPESGMFSGTTTLPLTPTAADHGVPIRLEITHGAKTITKEYIMFLKAFPMLSEITSNKSIGNYGSLLTLCCDVTGCDPKDVTSVTWMDSREQPAKGQQREKPGRGSLSCMLDITPTAEDYGKIYVCCVYYKDTKPPMKKNIHLKLPEKAPTLSDIMVRPAMVRADQEAKFLVIISGFSPRDIQVRWYKGFSQFPSKDVTSSDLQIGEDHLYTVTSTLTYTPRLSDDNIGIRCEVTHTMSRTIREKHYTLRLTGQSDIIDSRKPVTPEQETVFGIRRIECLTEHPCVGGEVTVVGHIDGCVVEEAEFSWYKGLFAMDETADNQQHGTGCTSTVTFRVEDPNTDCTIRLEVIYNYQTIEESYKLQLGKM